MGGVPLPEGYHSVNPYIVVDDAERLIHFLVQVFGAVEQGRSLRPDGRIDHADVCIGDTQVMLSEVKEAMVDVYARWVELTVTCSVEAS